jgi:hypothetical protein
MSTCVQEPAILSDLPDIRNIPIAEVVDGRYDLAGLVRHAMPPISGQERPSVSAFNSSI